MYSHYARIYQDVVQKDKDKIIKVDTCAVGPIGTPGTHTSPKGRVPKTLG